LDVVEGRVSPWCKEHIYRDWHLGATIRDMSLKYGLLPERIRAIVWQREYFWKEIYPKVGETGLRLGLELEFVYALDYPFVDYGKDLQHMVDRERGAETYTLRRSALDREVYPEMEHEFNNRFLKQKSRKYDLVPIKRSDSGTRSYLLFDRIDKRGKNKRTVSNMFVQTVFRSHKPHLLPDVVQRHLKYGPRVAAWHYKTK
jgi:hypothetical protein